MKYKFKGKLSLVERNNRLFKNYISLWKAYIRLLKQAYPYFEIKYIDMDDLKYHIYTDTNSN